jgi:hypothetical protein
LFGATGGWRLANCQKFRDDPIFNLLRLGQLAAGGWRLANCPKFRDDPISIYSLWGNWKMENRNWKVADLKINSNKELAQN